MQNPDFKCIRNYVIHVYMQLNEFEPEGISHYKYCYEVYTPLRKVSVWATAVNICITKSNKEE